MMNCRQSKLVCKHTFDALPTLPATRRGRAVVNAAHAFSPSFAGQFIAAGPAPAMCMQRCANPHYGNWDIFGGVAINSDILDSSNGK